jgi:signal transduction histidine kinase
METLNAKVLLQRTAELEKELAAKNRQLEIEASLERVRARTMAMQKSDELTEVASVLFQQVTDLGIKAWTTGFNVWSEDNNSYMDYITSPQGGFIEPYTVDATRFPAFSEISEARKKGEEFYVSYLDGEMLKQTYLELAKFGDKNQYEKMLEGGFQFPDRQFNHFVFGAKVSLMFITYEPMSEAREIFKRFGAVFEQAYTRFLDLQKAEAQAIRAEQDLIEIKAARKKAEDALTELRATQQQLIQREKMASLGELTAGIAHEIQNPLNFVNNFSETNMELIAELKEEATKGEIQGVLAIATDIQNNEEKINHHGKRADSIVKGMLEHSRSSRGEKEPVDINKLADEYLRLSYHGFRAKNKSFNATITTEFDNSVGKVRVVPDDIGRVLLNLFNNAFYAVNEKKQRLNGTFESMVQVSTANYNNHLVLKVSDNGNGIPFNIIAKIFQPFFTTKPAGQGTGLGLSLSYDIIKAHNGELKVESKNGEGSEFTITLPA